MLLSWGNGQQGQLGRVGSRMRELMATILLPHPVPFTRRLRGVGIPKVPCSYFELVGKSVRLHYNTTALWRIRPSMEWPWNGAAVCSARPRLHPPHADM